MTNDTKVVHVALGPRSYDIHIGSDFLEDAAEYVLRRSDVRQAVVITDENVEELYAWPVAESLGQQIEVLLMVVPPGEQTKCVEMANELWQQLVEQGADRKTLIVAVGGGVVGDLAGFVAATFARGIRFYQVPTSLLAQVDSSVGGKVGINLPQAKNMVGAFLQPVGVLIDTACLKTLPEREYKAGLAEVVKYGVILDEAFFAYLEENADAILNREPQTMQHVVARCCRLKADVVEQDETEQTGLRAVLNYGHTFAHAFETLTEYTDLLHGEAVAMGMICASRLAERLGRISSNVTERQRQLLEQFGLPTKPPASLSAGKILDVMKHDKKAQHGRVRLVLPSRLGQVELVSDVPEKLIAEVLEEMLG